MRAGRARHIRALVSRAEWLTGRIIRYEATQDEAMVNRARRDRGELEAIRWALEQVAPEALRLLDPTPSRPVSV